MKILLITDQHLSSERQPHFINSYRKFYSKIVIPFIKASGIDNIVDLGIFDKRRSINFMSLDEAKKWFDPVSELGYMHTIIGNHDIYYKNTLRVNAPDQLLSSYSNIITYDEPTVVNFDGLDVFILPWICEENKDECLVKIHQSKALSLWDILS